jgi:ABC-2 type transport system permease protein
MTAATTHTAVPRGASLGFGGLLRSEWIKFTSLRSTYWTSAIILVLWVGFAALLSTFTDPVTGPDGQEVAAPDELRQSLTLGAVTLGVTFGVLVAGIQGVLAMTGEYSTGMIRSSLTANPKRTGMYVAKAVVVYVWMFLLAAVASFASYGVAALLLGPKDLLAPLGSDELLVLLGAATYLGIVGLVGLGIGTLVRAGAGGIAIVVGLLLVLPVVAGLLGGFVDWVPEVVPYLLDSAGTAMSSVPMESLPEGAMGMPESLDPPIATAVAAAWAAVSLVLGGLALKTRDA